MQQGSFVCNISQGFVQNGTWGQIVELWWKFCMPGLIISWGRPKGRGGRLGGSIEPPQLKQLMSKTCDKFNIKGTQSFLKLINGHDQVTTIFKIQDIKTRWLCLRMAGIAFPRTWNFKNCWGRMLSNSLLLKPGSVPDVWKPVDLLLKMLMKHLQFIYFNTVMVLSRSSRSRLCFGSSPQDVIQEWRIHGQACELIHHEHSGRV